MVVLLNIFDNCVINKSNQSISVTSLCQCESEEHNGGERVDGYECRLQCGVAPIGVRAAIEVARHGECEGRSGVFHCSSEKSAICSRKLIAIRSGARDKRVSVIKTWQKGCAPQEVRDEERVVCTWIVPWKEQDDMALQRGVTHPRCRRFRDAHQRRLPQQKQLEG